jgi:hypothetical protein
LKEGKEGRNTIVVQVSDAGSTSPKKIYFSTLEHKQLLTARARKKEQCVAWSLCYSPVSKDSPVQNFLSLRIFRYKISSR